MVEGLKLDPPETLLWRLESESRSLKGCGEKADGGGGR